MTIEEIATEALARQGREDVLEAISRYEKAIVHNDVLLQRDVELISLSRELIARSRARLAMLANAIQIAGDGERDPKKPCDAALNVLEKSRLSL